MIDWFVMLTPVALLLLVPFLFLGCGLDAVGSMPAQAYLHFDKAVLSQGDPNAVDPRPIHEIGVYWTFRGNRVRITPGKANKTVEIIGPYLEQHSQAKGYWNRPFVLEIHGAPFFRQAIEPPDWAQITTVSCRCVLTFGEGVAPLEIPEVSMRSIPFGPHIFTLVRGITTPNLPGAPKGFSIQTESL